MKSIYKVYKPGEEIPFRQFVRYPKLVKYYTRETMAAMATLGEFIQEGVHISNELPFYYSSEETEMLDEYEGVFEKFALMDGAFSPATYVKEIVPTFSPISQFKMMRNMTHSLLSIEYGLKGDNATLLCASVASLQEIAISLEQDGPVLIGAGRLLPGGHVEVGFSWLQPKDR